MTPQPSLLDQLGILVGIALILSAASLLVTLLVQAVSAFLALRGSNLRWGIATLLHELDSTGKITAPDAEQIASAVLSHPLVSGSTTLGRIFGAIADATSERAKRWRLATAIRADELTAILHKLENEPTANAWKAIVGALPAGDAAQVDATIKDVGAWFDSSMDRVSQRFATHTRVLAIAFSFAIAIALHVDVLGIHTRLASGAPLRASFVGQAIAVTEDEVMKALPAATTSEARQRAVAKAYQEASGQWQVTLETLGPLGFLPDSLAAAGDFSQVSRLGILLGGLLLSLGAPFWFNMLRTLTSLRPVLAKKVDDKPRAAS